MFQLATYISSSISSLSTITLTNSLTETVSEFRIGPLNISVPKHFPVIETLI